jgi:predicted transglutaminase-like cysteine proteinase
MLGVVSPAAASSVQRPELLAGGRLPLVGQYRQQTIIAPLAHVRFCMENPSQCVRRSVSIRKGRVALTSERLQQLNEVTASLNRAIRPEPDGRLPFTDRWSLFPKKGDCDDYAVSKRARLLEMGWPSSALLLVQLRHTAAESHLVLMVSTAGGDFVLDNLTNQVLPADHFVNRIEKLQSNRDPNLWVRFMGPIQMPPLRQDIQVASRAAPKQAARSSGKDVALVKHDAPSFALRLSYFN